ncbi:MAG TPA: DinB family protein [Cyclobacteriaceae bacterium]|nr:DinB family protein [Cyclobacteriaceae bacterium]
MQLIRTAHQILTQLEDVLQQVDAQEFVQASPALSESTIGQHTRHTLEFFVCLEQALPTGTVNYDQRAHDRTIEEDKEVALRLIKRLKTFIHQYPDNQPLRLEVGYERHSEACVSVETNYYRELAYNIEHAVHHMALVKIGLRDVAPRVTLPVGFGIAVSTLRHQERVLAHN